jgi:hypothetical protein
MAQLGKRQHRLSDGYSFAGFRAQATVRGVFGDPVVRIVKLDRRSKKPSATAAVSGRQGGTTGGYGGFAICRAPGSASSWNSRFGAWRAAPAAP